MSPPRNEDLRKSTELDKIKKKPKTKVEQKPLSEKKKPPFKAGGVFDRLVPSPDKEY